MTIKMVTTMNNEGDEDDFNQSKHGKIKLLKTTLFMTMKTAMVTTTSTNESHR